MRYNLMMYLVTDWVSGNEEMMTNDDNLEPTSTLLN